MKRIKIFNARVLTPYRAIDNGTVIVEDGKIASVGGGDIKVADCTAVDAGGHYASPGFIDIHTHGGGGHDFMDGTVEAFLGAAEMHLKHGTTSLVPTTLAGSMEELKCTLEVYKEAKQKNRKGARFLGIHLEGPYFAISQKGAQDPRYIKAPSPEEYKAISAWSDDIIRWSAAPELDGAMEFGRYLSRKGILPSIGHSDAVYEQVQEAFENGFTHVTHLYSGMSGVRRINAYRHAGVVESAFLIDEMTVEIIADGCHLPASLLKLIHKIKGPEKTALVTDSMRAAGMPEGESILGSLKNGQKVIVEDGAAKLLSREAFAGSTATADRLVRTMTRLAGIAVADAVRMMTSTPARIMGVDKTKGSIAPGKDADIIIFDNDINIKAVIIKGETVFCHPEGTLNL